MSDEIRRVGVVGGGIMGTGIAEVCARAGCDVRLVESDLARAAEARDGIDRSLQRAVSRGKAEPAEAAAALGRIECVAELGQLEDRTVNALLIPFLLSAIRMFEQGLADAEDIDKGMVAGCAHPMGPLALADLIGLDTVMGVAETLYAEQREQLFAPPPLLQRLVSANLLGRKSGRGLYDHA